jgi:hypothetical protein
MLFFMFSKKKDHVNRNARLSKTNHPRTLTKTLHCWLYNAPRKTSLLDSGEESPRACCIRLKQLVAYVKVAGAVFATTLGRTTLAGRLDRNVEKYAGG